MNKISIKHINIILFGFFLLWNFCQPLIIDDLFRSVANSLPNHKLLQTLFSEYHNLTGRMSAQILVHLFFNKELDFISIPKSLRLLLESTVKMHHFYSLFCLYSVIVIKLIHFFLLQAVS